MFTCPVCGAEELALPPYAVWPPPETESIGPPYAEHLGAASYEVCPSCGFEFGFDDDPGAGDGLSFAAYFDEWKRDGRRRFDDHWTPALSLPASSHWLGRHDAAWVVGRPQSEGRPVDQAPLRLCAVLNWSWTEAQEHLARVEQRWPDLGAVPLEAVMRAALTSEVPPALTGRAIAWLHEGFPLLDVGEHLARIAEDARLPLVTRLGAAALVSPAT